MANKDGGTTIGVLKLMGTEAAMMSKFAESSSFSASRKVGGYRKIRLRYGLSAAAMSSILGLGANQWAKFQSGKVEPGRSHLLLIGITRDPRSFLKLVQTNFDEISGSIGERKAVDLNKVLVDLVGMATLVENAAYKEWVEELWG